MDLRVLMVTPYFPPTIKGPSLHVYHLVSNLIAQGIQVKVHTIKYTKQKKGLKFSDTNLCNLSISYFKPSFDLRGSSDDQPISVDYITSTIKDADHFDLIHVHDFPKICNDVLVLALKRLKHNRLIVLTPHGQGAPFPTFKTSSKIYWSLGIPGRVLHAVDHLIAVTSLQNKAFAKVCGQQKVSMISEAVPPNYFVKAPVFLDDDKLKVLYIGRIVREKGIKELLYAVNEVSKIWRNTIELRCIGPDYGFMQKALSIIEELHLEKAVSMLGPVPEDQKIVNLDWCDVLVLPSYYEAFGIPIVEAMARAKPVIATKTIGAMSLVRQNETGFLVNCGDPSGIASSLIQFINDPTLKYRLGKEALKYALPFSMQVMTKNHIDLYRNLVGD